ncbi:MAG TPA: SGNH/GDSL hydrolase family protein [Puia sp.]
MTYSLLTLGDSYTIGEGLPIYESYPYQAVQFLRRAGHPFSAPEIIARTGWTTDELSEGIAGTQLLPTYDFISLLIGVNNQYRGRSSQEYAGQFEDLLRQAIQFAGGQPTRAFVLSIPDWGVSPFATTHLPDTAGRGRIQITREIDAFNRVAEKITGAYKVEFIDITGHSATPLFASDGLHPSGEQYRYWAEQLAGRIEEELARSINTI